MRVQPNICLFVLFIGHFYPDNFVITQCTVTLLYISRCWATLRGVAYEETAPPILRLTLCNQVNSCARLLCLWRKGIWVVGTELACVRSCINVMNLCWCSFNDLKSYLFSLFIFPNKEVPAWCCLCQLLGMLLETNILSTSQLPVFSMRCIWVYII